MKLSHKSYVKRVRHEIESREGYDNPHYSRAQWRADVASGATLNGYYDVVTTYLLGNMPAMPIPAELGQFKLKRPVGNAARERALEHLRETGYSIHSPGSALIAAVLEEAFLLQQPFSLFGPATTTNPCRDLAVVMTRSAMETAQDLREAEHVELFTWDGYSPLPNLSEFGVRNERHINAIYG